MGLNGIMNRPGHLNRLIPHSAKAEKSQGRAADSAAARP